MAGLQLDLAAWIGQGVFAALVVFARVGSAMMLLPAFSAAFIPPQVRLMLALAVTLLVVPAVPDLPRADGDAGGLVALVVGEAVIGLMIGGLARLLFTALEVAGMIIALQSGLASAFLFNPQLETQGSIPGALLTLVGLVLIVLTDLHHLMLLALADSYRAFPVGELPAAGDLAALASATVARAFLIGVQLSAPFMVAGLVFYVGLGLLNRLMPQLQLFFLALPAQIALGLAILALTLPTLLDLWLVAFTSALRALLGFGGA